LSKKILFVSSSIQFYENFLYETIHQLNHSNQISIITNIDNQSYNFDDVDLRNINFSRSFNPLKDLITSFQLASHIKTLKPDIIISSSPKGGLVATLVNLFFQLPRIHILSGILWSDRKHSLLNRIAKIIDFITFKFSKLIYLDSQSQIDFLLRYNIPKVRLSLIANGSMKGVNLNKFEYNKTDIQIRKKRYNLSGQTLILLFLGRISPEKGIETYLSSIIELFNEGYDIKGLIVGRDEKNILKKYRKKNLDFHQYFQYLEYTDQPEFFLQLADIVLIPSSREGFCQVAIEASACEVPVVGFNVIGLIDSIKQNESGFLVPYNDIGRFKEKIKLLLEDSNLRRQMGKKGREFVKYKYSQEEIIKKFTYQLEEDLKKLCK
jgi:glycosyltransferase involved in cell wall biosynthesis